MTAALALSATSAQPGLRLVDGADLLAVQAAVNAINNPAPVAIAASGAVSPSSAQTYVITKAGVAALTLAAPVAGKISAGGNDGVSITIISTTANAHTITATGIMNNGSTSVNVATFAAYPGASIDLVAYNAQWYVIGATAITFS